MARIRIHAACRRPLNECGCPDDDDPGGQQDSSEEEAG